MASPSTSYLAIVESAVAQSLELSEAFRAVQEELMEETRTLAHRSRWYPLCACLAVVVGVPLGVQLLSS